jgi:NADH-quinone oxidoreductase subunit C
MDFQAIHDHLKAVGAPGLIEADLPREPNKAEKDPGRAGDPFLVIDPLKLNEFLTVCRDDPKLRFELLVDETATDPAVDDESLWINLNILSAALHHRLAIKCFLPKAKAIMPTVCAVYRAAQWHEREAAEMFGITFVGHPDPRNVLLPDDWEGFPLRKDYEFPKEYHGISCE